MKKTATTLAAVGLVAALSGGAVAFARGTDDAAPWSRAAVSAATPQDDPQVAAGGARTRLTEPAVATGDPEPAGLRTARPTAGRVVRLAGPFDDRYRLRDVRLATERGAVSGTLRVTSDVSDLLELQVVAGFYDRQGRYLGLGRFTHHLEEGGHTHEGPPSETEAFTVRAPAGVRDRVASASLGVPVLVNE